MPMTLSPSTPPTKSHQVAPSPFAEVTPKYTSEQIAASISMEIKKMQRRRQLQYPGSGSPTHPSMDMPSSSGRDSPPSAVSPSSSLYNALSPNKRDVPLFTFRQVSMICERMVKDREDQIREEYNSVLTNKIAEQYEAFLKFNHDQLRRRFGDAPMSYVS